MNAHDFQGLLAHVGVAQQKPGEHVQCPVALDLHSVLRLALDRCASTGILATSQGKQEVPT
jgi:hypothetical protein